MGLVDNEQVSQTNVPPMCTDISRHLHDGVDNAFDERRCVKQQTRVLNQSNETPIEHQEKKKKVNKLKIRKLKRTQSFGLTTEAQRTPQKCPDGRHWRHRRESEHLQGPKMKFIYYTQKSHDE